MDLKVYPDLKYLSSVKGYGPLAGELEENHHDDDDEKGVEHLDDNDDNDDDGDDREDCDEGEEFVDDDDKEKMDHRSLQQLVESELLQLQLVVVVFKLGVEVVHCRHLVPMTCQHGLFQENNVSFLSSLTFQP